MSFKRVPATTKSAQTYALQDHLCKGCGGRILKMVTGAGPTGGGNPIFKCADCGKATSGFGPDVLCWCGFHHKHNHNSSAYTCLPFSIIETYPAMRQAFASCGCDPTRGEVGIVLTEQYEKILRAAQEE